MTGGIEIRPAASPEELEAVYRFRYRIYVEEMHRKQLYADHERRLIQDPLDPFSINLVAWKGSEVIGAIRNNAAEDGPLGQYEAFYEMHAVGNDHPTRTSITTRLMLAPEHRRGPLAIRLANASYQIGLERNVRWNFIDCNDHLLNLFTGLGWIAHLPPAAHPEYGVVHRLRLDLFDSNHLAAVSSPFARLHEEFRATNA
jgi:GNAT superfamily N-acetyltransferase